MATRGRPPVIEKAELPLSDGTVVLLRLVGDGQTVQIELPDQWTLGSMERSPLAGSGRTRLSFVSTKRGKAKGARAPKATPALAAPTRTKKAAPAASVADEATPAAPPRTRARKAAPAKAAAPARTRRSTKVTAESSAA